MPECRRAGPYQRTQMLERYRHTRRAPLVAAIVLGLTFTMTAPAAVAQTAAVESPVVIGRSFALPTSIMDGPRELNVWLPPGYEDSDARYPVLYLLDGGQAQDFHHISGLAQLGTVNGATRDVIVVGIASVDRRNELALPTRDPDLIELYPTQGQSDRFRRFVAEEVLPFIEGRFRTSGENVLMGESLAGLFVVETFLKEPRLFDAYVAVSPSLWWDGGDLARQAEAHLRTHPDTPRSLMLTIADEGGEMQAAMDDLVAGLRRHASPSLAWNYRPRPAESHATTYHGAALDAFRELFAVPDDQ